ncbi:hypothetical protein MKK58_08370 [Methylobacterium sp. J-078]|nr:hypothetical protein [Methylobacterium sp. J-078]
MRQANDFSRHFDPARLIVGLPAPAHPMRALALMALRVLLFLAVLAGASLGFGPARAFEGEGLSDTGKPSIPGKPIVATRSIDPSEPVAPGNPTVSSKPPVSGTPTVSGMNPGPLPKNAAPKPPAPKLSVAVKLVDTKAPETTGAIEPRAEATKPIETVQVAEVRLPEPAPEPVKAAVKPPAYCASIADAAADARFAWQKEQLATLERQVEERIAKLEAKRAEYESWLARRNAFLAKADEGVVAIYTKMRADAAALQLANMPDESAAAILTKLNARTASAILSEMEAARAAQLARMMTELGKRARESEKS